ncbi:MAG: hypothetical protein LDL50_05750 [Chloroflexi bacterium]|nr:hypothetical protein [Chloroflexota bacterium]MCA2002118.1 hypothetical protein [Chloroflexota bacterium]
MLKKAFPILLALSVALTACMGQPAEPTMSPADIEGTAVSAAMTMVAETQAAIPTPTPVPPTETPSPTPLPTFTPEPIVVPTLEPLILPTATSASSTDNCLKPLNMGEAGPTSPLRIENESGGTIEWISLNLIESAFGQCGALSYNNIKPNEKKVIALPRGTWWVWAGIKYKNGSSSNASGTFVVRPADTDMIRIIVGSESISAKP